MEAADYDNAPLLHTRLLNSRAEATSLRNDLGDAIVLIEGLEAELWAVTTRWSVPDKGQCAAAAVSLLIQARTQVMRALVQDLPPEQARAAAQHDLRIAEAAFSFLLGLRSLRAGSHPT